MTKIKSNKKNLLTKDMNISEVLFKYPQIAEVFVDYGMHCVGCIASTFDSIEAGAKVHGLSDDEIAEMMEKVNEVILYKKNEKTSFS